MNATRIRLWDLPTRVFHWVLAASVIGAMVTGQLGGNLIEWHGRLGVLIVGLLVFRLVWGIVGSTYARFAQFMPTPCAIRAYLRGEWRGEGHNPLGALSVIALLGLLLAQALTGLAANDDIAFYGPLHELAGRELSNRLTGLHHLMSKLLMALAALHVAAIVFYLVARKKNLVKPMVTGWKDGSEGPSAGGGGIASFVVALGVAVVAVYGASGAWMPEPPPLPAAETPNW